MPESEVKSILREIVFDLVDLRASFDLHTQFGGARATIAEVREARGPVLQRTRESYDKLLKRIEELA